MIGIGTKLTVAAVLLNAASGAAWGLTAEGKCEADKNKEAGKYALCRQNAEAKAIRRGEPPDYSRCDTKLLAKWANAEQMAINRGASCIDSVTDGAIQSFVTAHSDAVATALDGGALPDCGDGSINVAGEQCDGIDLGGEDCTTLGFGGGTLACDGSCALDTSSCGGACGAFPASGQTTAHGTGSDGDVEAGASLSYTDNGDGTITDNNTGLMWEKKSDDGSIHDVDDTYAWCGPSCGGTDEMDGTITTTFLSTLNGGGGFAGYTDWRIPNVRELQSIVDYEAFSPAVASAFDNACGGGCMVATCSCTALSIYWSSTTDAEFPERAWEVNFYGGNVNDSVSKSIFRRVRAVRGGS